MFDGQTKKFCSAVVDALPEVTEEVMQGWVENPRALNEALKEALCPPGEAVQLESIPAGILHFLKSVTLAATNGQETIAQAKEVFPGFIDPDFKNWGCDVTSESTPEMPVALHELVQDGDFRTIFTSLGTDLDKLCLTQPQIIQFCRQHQRLLSADGYATFFLFKANNEFFVAIVDWSDRKLKVDVSRLSDDFVWNGEYCPRVVVPQLTPVTPGA